MASSANWIEMVLVLCYELQVYSSLLVKGVYFYSFTKGLDHEQVH